MRNLISDLVFTVVQFSRQLASVRSLLIPLSIVSLVACSGSGFDDFPVDDEPNAQISGGAVKGPLISAVATVYAIDYSAPDLKGAIVTTGSTDARGVLTGIVVPGAEVQNAPFLIEYTGGTELDGSTPVIPTLRTVITLDQLRNDVAIYATPLTTVAIELARLNADLSNTTSAAANFLAALDSQQQIVKDYFGLGVLGNVDLFTTSAVILFGTDQAETLNHRTAIETLGAVMVELAAIDINTPVDDLLLGLAQDLADGIPDAAVGGGAVASLAGIGAAPLLATLTQSADELSALIVPGTAGTTMTPVSGVNQMLVDEAAVIAAGVTAQLQPAPVIHKIVPGTDTDGDLVVDSEDGFPQDPDRIGDSDMDGFDDLIDEFPDDINEWEDTDGDGVGNNGDAFPDDPNRQVPADNSVPVAVAGADFTVVAGDVTMLDGSGSSDPDNDPLSFAWQLAVVPVGSTAALNNANTVSPDFTPDLAGDYVLNLSVDDGFDTASDSITVTAIGSGMNSPPVANAGPDQDIQWMNTLLTVSLDGSASSDPDMDPITYSWSIVSFVPSGANPAVPVTLIGPDMAMPTFAVSDVDQLGAYTIRLTVSDGTLQSTDDVIITIAKSFPTASVLFGSGLFGMAGVAIRYRRRLLGSFSRPKR